MRKIRRLIPILLVLTMIASACNGEQAAPTTTSVQEDTTTSESVDTTEAEATTTTAAATTTTEMIPDDAVPLNVDFSLDLGEVGADAAPNNETPTNDPGTQAGMLELFDIYRRDIVRQWAPLFDSLGIQHPNTAFEWIEAGETVTSACTHNGSQVSFDTNFNNAVYCPADNTIYMPVQTFITAHEDCVLFEVPTACGDMAIGGIMSHEYGHAITHWLKDGLEKKGHVVYGPIGKNEELFPDCLAGMYFRTLQTSGYDEPGDFGALVRIMGDMGDYEVLDPGHHGTPSERREAVMLGASNNLIDDCTFGYGVSIVGNVVVETPNPTPSTTAPPPQTSGIVSEITGEGYAPPVYSGTGQSGLAYMDHVLTAITSRLGASLPPVRYFFEVTDQYAFCGYAQRTPEVNAQSIDYCTEGDQPAILVGKTTFDAAYGSNARVGELAGVLLIARQGAVHASMTVPGLSGTVNGNQYVDCLTGQWLGNYNPAEIQPSELLFAYLSISEALSQAGIAADAFGAAGERQQAFLAGYTGEGCGNY